MNFIVNESKEKLRGGYYTPEFIARYLARWICSSGAKSVLEPSCGDGEFVSALSMERAAGRVIDLTAIELLDEEAAKTRDRSRKLAGVRVSVLNEDFLGWSLSAISRAQQYDAVIGNPPFIRYQYLPAEYQQRAETIFKAFHLPFTKHTNAWVPFVVASMGLLRPGGRLGMVLPAEVIHVMHAQALRTFLGITCKRLLIIDPEEIWFKGTLQGAVMLMVEKKTQPQGRGVGLAIQRVSGTGFLSEDPQSRFESARFVNGKTVEGKWTRALMPESARTLYDSLSANKDVKSFAQVADVDVGIVTGANKFFLVPNSVVAHYGLCKWAHPMFGRSEHCPGVIYDQRQHEENADRGLPTNFLWFAGLENKELPAQIKSYVRLGEQEGLHKRFKCRMRSPWFEVPSVYATEVGMLKRCHNAPRLIQNVLGAYTTDTAYRIRTKGCGAAKLVFCFLNSLTALSAELEGRHYGGGVLELVPSEIERLLVPLPVGIRPAVTRLDGMVRSRPMSEILVAQDRFVLDTIGVSRAEQERIHEAWRALRDRRHRVSHEGGLDDLESEDGRDSLTPVNTKRRIQEVAASY